MSPYLEDRLLRMCMRPVLPPPATDAEIHVARRVVAEAGWEVLDPDITPRAEVWVDDMDGACGETLVELLRSRHLMAIRAPDGEVYVSTPHEIADVVAGRST